MSTPLASLFLSRSRHYLGVEYPAKIHTALHTIPADRLWWRPNASANSAGNLVLHLAGNVRQWVVSGIGGESDTRQRDLEFSLRDGAANGWDHARLLDTLDHACRDSCAVIGRLDAQALTTERHIQGRDTTVASALYHVVEHFSGHTGQIILIAKWLTPDAVRFYDDRDGLARPLFLPDGASDVD
jgi:uncharacterized damage-inducible protein DinB